MSLLRWIDNDLWVRICFANGFLPALPFLDPGKSIGTRCKFAINRLRERFYLPPVVQNDVFLVRCPGSVYRREYVR